MLHQKQYNSMDELTKRDWNRLERLSIVDTNEGNGFSNTTDDFEEVVPVLDKPTYICIGETFYVVQYVNGCFYPIWYKGGNPKTHFYRVNEKSGKIAKVSL